MSKPRRSGGGQAPGGGNRGRAPRLEAAIREELSAQIPALKDPRVVAAGSVSVNLVKMNVDNRVARVYVSFVGGPPGEAEADKATEAAIEGLTRAAGMLRGEIGRALGIKFAPELRFVHDRTTDAIRRIDEVIREDEEKGKGRVE